MSQQFNCIYWLKPEGIKSLQAMESAAANTFSKVVPDKMTGGYAESASFQELRKSYSQNSDIGEILNSQVKPVLVCDESSNVFKNDTFKEDFTIFLDRTPDSDDEVEKLLKSYQPKAQSSQRLLNYQLNDSAETNLKLNLLSPRKKYSYESELWVCNSAKTLFARGRIAACLSNQGSKWSLTFRKKEEYPKNDPDHSRYLNKQEHIYGILYDIIFNEGTSKSGLIVIAGRTGSMKSQVANGFIESYLKERKDKGQERTPHLLTYEDPIEKVFKANKIGNADYTPREKNKDTPQLDEVINLALRQTPAIMFVGETRDPKDWESLLRFAGTGHLVITTTHAGSLTEAMENIFQATKAHTPAARNVVADRLLAMIHLRPKEIKGGSEKVKKDILLPALWHSTPSGVKALMAEGLSSLLPNNPSKEDEKAKKLPSSIGRYWFAGKLWKKSKHKPNSSIKEPFLKTAKEWDLGGI